MADLPLSDTSVSPTTSPSSFSFLLYTLRWGIAIGVLVASVLVRAVVTKSLISLISSAFGRLGSQGEENTKKAAELLSGPLSFLTVVSGLVVARLLVDLPDDLEEIVNNFIKSLLDILVFWIIFGAITPISHIIQKTSTGAVAEEIRKVLVDLSKSAVLVLGCLSVLQFWGINVGAFLAGFGLVGMAVALAAQDTIKNLFASLAMFADRAFSKGDWILTSEVEGIIEQVGLRTTAIRKFDTSLVLIPNSNLSNTAITNFNKCTLRRISWTLPIAGDATADQLIAVVEGIRKYLNEHPGVDQTTIIVSLDKFGENCVDLMTYFFLKELRWKEFMEEKESVLLDFARIVSKAGTRFGVPTRCILLRDLTHK